MDVKSTLKAITLELRRELEGKYDAQGTWQPGDLERRLAAIGVRRDRTPVPVDELSHLAPEDREARRVIDAFLQSRAEAGQSREVAIAEFVRDAAYTWANRLLALRCMEARSLIDEIILQKDAYGGRSLQHNRLAKKQPERCAGEDEGLFAALLDEFARRAEELPVLFDPRAPEVALRPSVAALKRSIALLSGTLAVKGQEAATDEVFTAADALGWTYQYWNTEEKDRVFEKVRTKKGSKIEGAEIVPATCIYTEPYMVKFLVQNSLGAIWMGMHPDSRLVDSWEYYVRGADRAPVPKKAIADITFLDPACGSGHFLIEAFELFYAMYVGEGALTDPAQICASILERNLYGIDIDERAAQIAALALVMKAKEKAPDFVPRRVNIVATNIRLPAGKEHLEAFLTKHPEDAPLKPALLAIFEGLAHADELGSLLQIEEPVEKELRALKARYEAAGSPMEQQALWSQFQKPVQGKLPMGVASYEQWKQDALARLHEHFDAEAHEADLGTAFFSEAAGKGLSLVDLLARRYDVVAANPPYMGSNNMGPILKRHVEAHFAEGKRDLFAAFILRCLELAVPNSGRIAMVTQQAWMFMLQAYPSLRASPEDTPDSRRFGGLLRVSSIEALAHLGEHAFHDSAAAGAFVVLFVAAARRPAASHRIGVFRLVGPTEPERKDALLRQATRGSVAGVSYRPRQAMFLDLPDAPLCYALPEALAGLLSKGNNLGKAGHVTDGIKVISRFYRLLWETSEPAGNQFSLYSKGGGYGRWFGWNQFVIRWEGDGRLLKTYVKSTYPADKFTLLVKEHDRKLRWLVWSDVGRGSLGVRLAPTGMVIGHAGPGIGLPEDADYRATLAFLNSRAISFTLRAVTSTLTFGYKYVERLALPNSVDRSDLVDAAISLKRGMCSRSPLEWSFNTTYPRTESLKLSYWAAAREEEALVAALLTIEGALEHAVVESLRLSPDDVGTIIAETGSPAGWYQPIEGYTAVDSMDEAEAVSGIVRALPRRSLSTVDRSNLKQRLRAHYEVGAGVASCEDDADEGEDSDSADGTPEGGGAIPVPAETLIEQLSRQLEVHPISVQQMLRELREVEGAICEPEYERFVLDYIGALVLRLLGHQWPREVGGNEPVPVWADKDGLIPLTEGTSEPALIARLRARLAEDFGADRAGAVEREFQEITGRPLGAWLASDFFKRHISQFRKRPIAWHLASTAASNTKRRGRGAVQTAPAFACLLYYHRLDADLIPKLRTQYVGPLRTSLQTELAALEKMPERSADQDARRVELEAKLEEMKAFDARLEQVLTAGFASPALDKIAAKEPLDKWTSRDGRARTPETRDAFLAQERRYAPDLNDGVRVNIAPLQRAGLLAADVLAAKDVEKAIADRAEWRADERRWCREGKLPQPGWWRGSEATLRDRQ